MSLWTFASVSGCSLSLLPFSDKILDPAHSVTSFSAKFPRLHMLSQAFMKCLSLVSLGVISGPSFIWGFSVFYSKPLLQPS